MFPSFKECVSFKPVLLNCVYTFFLLCGNLMIFILIFSFYKNFLYSNNVWPVVLPLANCEISVMFFSSVIVPDIVIVLSITNFC